jgi:D-alanyl-lipoteichoic acid acyltransferase DltB (MBOAT superfamily)
VFYGSWDWRFLPLLVATIVVDYLVGLELDRLARTGATLRRRQAVLGLSIAANLAVLGFFKYVNFFAESLQRLLASVGLPVELRVLEVVLPVGISFYTFQSMSYTIDVYRGEIAATRRFLDYALFISFFPHLVAGPIMRAAELLPQVSARRRTSREQVIDGLHLMLWGFWKKLFVADNLAPIVERIFSQSSPEGFTTLIGAYAFAWQIYADFSGYTDIARGAAKLLGFELSLNFARPYFAGSMRDFWRRWHISLSSWLGRYLYRPLGGNCQGRARTYRNLLLTMALAGLWHGAAWTFVLWGLFHGALLILERLLGESRRWLGEERLSPWRVPAWLRVVLVFHLVCLGWLVFRAERPDQLGAMLLSFGRPLASFDLVLAGQVALFALPLLALEAVQAMAARLYWLRFDRLPAELRVACYSAMLYLIVFVPASPRAFVYFQF